MLPTHKSLDAPRWGRFWILIAFISHSVALFLDYLPRISSTCLLLSWSNEHDVNDIEDFMTIKVPARFNIDRKREGYPSPIERPWMCTKVIFTREWRAFVLLYGWDICQLNNHVTSMGGYFIYFNKNTTSGTIAGAIGATTWLSLEDLPKHTMKILIFSKTRKMN